MTNRRSIVENEVPKIEAARRQLAEAILLFFQRGDAIVVHTLTAAAHQILFDLCRHKGIQMGSQIKDHPRVRPDKKSGWLKIVKGPENFFKHADNDPEATIDFAPALTVPYIVDAIEMHQMITGTNFLEASIFMIYFIQLHPETIISPALRNFLSAVRQRQIRAFDPDALEKYAGAIRYGRRQVKAG